MTDAGDRPIDAPPTIPKGRPVKPRDIFTWKFLFYHGLLPALRRLGPARGDAVARRRWAGRRRALWPPRRERVAALHGASRRALGADWAAEALRPELAAGTLRFLARDYLLDTDDDAQALGRFDVTGARRASESPWPTAEAWCSSGSHLGGHIAAFHWLYRRGVPLRLMVQRPRHVSAELDRVLRPRRARAAVGLLPPPRA